MSFAVKSDPLSGETTLKGHFLLSHVPAPPQSRLISCGFGTHFQNSSTNLETVDPSWDLLVGDRGGGGRSCLLTSLPDRLHVLPPLSCQIVGLQAAGTDPATPLQPRWENRRLARDVCISSLVLAISDQQIVSVVASRVLIARQKTPLDVVLKWKHCLRS